MDSLVGLFLTSALSQDGGFYFGGISWLPERFMKAETGFGTGGQQRHLIPGCNPVGITEKEPYPEHYVTAPDPTGRPLCVQQWYHYKASKDLIFQ